jgi:hypothetical protein
MQRSFLVIVFIPLLFAQRSVGQLPADTTGEIQVRFNRNIEFAGFVFFMGSMADDAARPGASMGNGILKKDWFGYDLMLARQYSAFRDDADLQTAAGYLENMEAAELFPLLLNVADFPQASLRKDIMLDKIAGFAPGKDSLAAATAATHFLDALNRFYRRSSFEQYYRQAHGYYQHALSGIRSVLPARGSIAAMEKFYGKHFDGYVLMPSLTIPSGMAFGVKLIRGGRTVIYNIFGPYAVPLLDTTRMQLGFDNAQHILELSVHEFGHSFVNPVVLDLPDSFFQATASLFTPLVEAMDNQGYQTWKTCLVEHFVRAGEIIIARKTGRVREADDLLKNYVETRKFVYLPKIIPVLETAIANGQTYAEAVNLAIKVL